MDKTQVSISKYWNNPEIKTMLNDDLISLSIALPDFISALKEEIGSVSTVFTQKQFDSKIDAAVLKVIEKIKEESAKAV